VRSAPRRSPASAYSPKTPPDPAVARATRGAVSFSPRWLRAELERLLPDFPATRVCVAFSGGLDSTVLLAAVAQLRTPALAVRALHIDHGLNPQSRAWSRHCARVASALGIPLRVRRARIVRVAGQSLEALARAARYRILSESLEPGEALLSAHHQDDQLETVLLQLLRGAGIAGLAAMPASAACGRGILLRPLLSVGRAQLARWAQRQHLEWVEDDSNAELHFDRNYLRAQVLPALRARWPAAARNVARSARHAAEALELLTAQAAADAGRASVGAALSARVLRTLPPARRHNALRYWIARHGQRVPPESRLQELAGAVLRARADAHPSVGWDDVRVQRNGDLLCLSAASAATPPAARLWDWRAQRRCPLAGAATLELRPDAHGPLDLDRLPLPLNVATRQGGEELRPRRGGPTRTLKRLLQESRLPPRVRAQLPLLFSGPQLLAVADLWLDESVQARPGSRRRARLIYRVPKPG
jgi:tRNA(Ile)-lysidine synthase